jgi:phytoene dehydrogenase-like protein
MVGSKPGDGYRELYEEVGVLEPDTKIYNAESIKIEIDGVMYDIPLSYEKFREFLYSLSPEDSEKIDELCKNINVFMNGKMPAGTPTGLFDAIKVLKESRGFLSIARKYLGMTVGEFVKPLHSAKLRSLLCSLMLEDFSMMGLIMMLGTRMGGNAGYPIGGALDVIKRMQLKYTSLGGKLNLNSKVEEIVVENGKAAGLRLNSKFYPSDSVIAACDAHDILKNMLHGKYKHPQLDAMLESSPLFPPLALVSFGLNRKFDIPFSIQYECPEGLETAPGNKEHMLALRSFDFDPTAAPENCSSVMAMIGAPLEYWKNLRKNDINEYKNQKQKLADTVAEELNRRIPGLKDAIVVTDVATPVTYERLTNAYKASYEGFAPIPSALKARIKKTVPGIKNLHICGQWTTAGGGICTAVGSGKEAAYEVLKEIR